MLHFALAQIYGDGQFWLVVVGCGELNRTAGRVNLVVDLRLLWFVQAPWLTVLVLEGHQARPLLESLRLEEGALLLDGGLGSLVGRALGGQLRLAVAFHLFI